MRTHAYAAYAKFAAQADRKAPFSAPNSAHWTPVLATWERFGYSAVALGASHMLFLSRTGKGAPSANRRGQ